MGKTNVFHLPLVENLCRQLLREVGTFPELGWSIAHITINPRTRSRLHIHRHIEEVYIVTRGTGDLFLKNTALRVQPGDIIHIPKMVEHAFINTSMATTEYLVIAVPSFTVTDVTEVARALQYPDDGPLLFPQRNLIECFDGGTLIESMIPGFPSITFGWVSKEFSFLKGPHYHKQTTEHIYIVEGEGGIEMDGHIEYLGAGDWLRIRPNTLHKLFINNRNYMIVVSICSPPFAKKDVCY